MGRTHWAYCARDRVKWFIGENLFSSWRHMTKVEFERNAEILEGCEEAESLYLPEGRELVASALGIGSDWR